MMTTRQSIRRKRFLAKETIRLATWNIMSWNTRDQEIIMEISEKHIDICALQETKKKGKGMQQYGEYVLIYSGKNKEERAKEGVGMLIHKKFKPYIENITYTNERIIKVQIKMKNKCVNVISVYAPDISKPKQQREQFYEELQEVIDTVPLREHIIILGDLNARVGAHIIPNVKQRFNEEVENENGELLVDFCCQNNMRINNTFFVHSERYKTTWRNTRGQTSVIDYVITSRSIHPTQILDVRTLNSANIGSDHSLLLCKLRLEHTIKRQQEKIQPEEKINIESLNNESTKEFYQRRLKQKISLNEIKHDDDVEKAWVKLKTNIIAAAEEACGKRKVAKKNSKTPWFSEEIKQLSKEKKVAYLKYKTTGTAEDLDHYKNVRNRANMRIRNLKEEYWERFTKDVEHDLTGAQTKVWKMVRNRKADVNESCITNGISTEEWFEYFKNVYSETDNIDNLSNRPTSETDTNIEVTLDDIQTTLRKLKGRKASGPDGIANEMLKYGGHAIQEEILKFVKMVLQFQQIPKDMKTSYTIPILKKGDRKKPENYRGITLLSTLLKVITKIILMKLNTIIKNNEEQMGFRTNRSTTDAIFTIRQICEKSIEYNNPAYICFVDLTKAFDRVKLDDVLSILEEKNVPQKLINLIRNIYQNTKTRIKTINGLTDEISIHSGIRQGDSLSPMLFNIVMDKIIDDIRPMKGYKMGRKNINIVCYADDAVLIADTEDDLQRMLHQFVKSTKIYNMEVSKQKTKCLTISREPIRCKLEIERSIIEQVMTFRYLGVNISSSRDVQAEVKDQTIKGAVASGCLRDIIWRNKYMSTQNKIRIYKSCIRPILTYGAETRPDTSKTKQMITTTEMRTLRCIIGKTLRDRVPNQRIREQCEIQDITKFIKVRRKEWNAHVDRMDNDRLPKVARDAKPSGKRPPGRPPKRWAQSWLSSSIESPPRQP